MWDVGDEWDVLYVLYVWYVYYCAAKRPSNVHEYLHNLSNLPIPAFDRAY